MHTVMCQRIAILVWFFITLLVPVFSKWHTGISAYCLEFWCFTGFECFV